MIASRICFFINQSVNILIGCLMPNKTAEPAKMLPTISKFFHGGMVRAVLHNGVTDTSPAIKELIVVEIRISFKKVFAVRTQRVVHVELRET